jgi:aspartate racemase
MAKRIGILGGLAPESTVSYYQHIVRSWQRQHGNHAFPEIVIYSVSFQRYEDWMEAGEWDRIEEALGDALRCLRLAGADFAVLATNTMHLLFDRLQARAGFPLLSIVDATGQAVQGAGLRVVGLLGTRFTMERPFYRDGLERRGISTVVPDAADRDEIHRVIVQELSLGELKPSSRQRYLDIIGGLVERGAQGIVLGCTEIPLLVTSEHASVPLFDTAALHAQAALAYAVD